MYTSSLFQEKGLPFCVLCRDYWHGRNLPMVYLYAFAQEEELEEEV
jgi:hypothetical protein